MKNTIKLLHSVACVSVLLASSFSSQLSASAPAASVQQDQYAPLKALMWGEDVPVVTKNQHNPIVQQTAIQEFTMHSAHSFLPCMFSVIQLVSQADGYSEVEKEVTKALAHDLATKLDYKSLIISSNENERKKHDEEMDKYFKEDLHKALDQHYTEQELPHLVRVNAENLSKQYKDAIPLEKLERATAIRALLLAKQIASADGLSDQEKDAIRKIAKILNVSDAADAIINNTTML